MRRSMKTYLIKAEEVYATEIQVEAKSKKEALKIASQMLDERYGYGLEEPEYSHTVDHKEWYIEEI
jgi:mannitol/fructose-specific phosphotransferase system IIA component (Ntr-type)